MNAQKHARKRMKSQRQEGAVLLIVLLILLMATSTATFAIQSTGYEIRAAGGMKQSMRTRYAAESFANAGLSALDAGIFPFSGSMDFYASLRAKYGLSDYAIGEDSRDDKLYEFAPATFTTFLDEVAPSDQTLATAGAASSYVPTFNGLAEAWVIDDKKKRCRYVASAYGELAVPGDVTVAGDARGIHESVSVSRFYYDGDCP